MGGQPEHRVSIVVDGQQVDGWTTYSFESSMVRPVDSFTLARPFDAQIHRLLTADSKIKIKIDDTAILVGYIDERKKVSSRDGSMTQIIGRDKAGHMVQESAPFISYNGLDLLVVAQKLADPWFTKVVLSDARNRRVRTGRYGHKASAPTEPLILKVRRKTWQVEPGQPRWKILEELVSEAGYLMWSSADGEELIIGKPNYKQDVQFLLLHTAPGSTRKATVESMTITESVADRFSLIMAVGSGQGDSVNYGESTVTRRGIVRNGSNPDGTGNDFKVPKRLVLSEHHLTNVDEAQARAQQEMNRRDIHALTVEAGLHSHGQIVAGTSATIFAPNTLARVIDEETDPEFDRVCLIHTCKYSANRDRGEETVLHLVPQGTSIVQ